MLLDVPFQPDRASGCFFQGQNPQRASWCHYAKSTKTLQNEVAQWIIGDRNARGTLLVTGLRGVGKSSFVAQALREAARQISPRASAERSCLLVVWLDLPQAMPADKLLGRMIRRLYVEMTRAGLGEICPDIVARARAAYVRTLADQTQSTEHSVGVSLGAKGGMEIETDGFKLNAEAEYRFMRKLELAYHRNDAERSEEDIQELLVDLADPVGSSDVVQRTVDGFRRRLSALKTWAAGSTKTDVRVVFVLDELDKMQEPGDFEKVFGALKSLLSTSHATFILVAGAEQEARWLRAEHEADSILASLVSWRAYVPTIQDVEELKKVVEKLTNNAGMNASHAAVLLARSGGVHKAVARILRTEFSRVPDAKVEPKAPARFLATNQPIDPFGGKVGKFKAQYHRDALRAWVESARWLDELALYSSEVHKEFSRLGLPAHLAPQLAAPQLSPGLDSVAAPLAVG